MRNNKDRLQAPAESSDPAEAMAGKTNSLFDFVSPTHFVELPTKGRFYPEGHPLRGEKATEIRFMTAKDEDILTSKALLKSGLAIDRFISNILVDQSINVDTLYVADKNAIMIAARITGFGAEYTTHMKCPACAQTSENSFDLNDVTPYYGDEERELSSDGTFTIELPTTKVQAQLKLLTGEEERKLASLAESKAKKNLPETTSTDQLKSIIVSLNGQTERSTINKFCDLMPAPDSRFLKRVYRSTAPGVDMKSHFACSACGHEQEVEIPLTADFFWSNR